MSRKKIILIEPPFYRLYKESYALEMYPLSLGYLAATVKRDTDWDVMVYNSDFVPDAEMVQLSYVAGQGYENYLNNLKSQDSKVWQDVRTVIKEYSPDVVGITAKSQNFAAVRIVARIVKECCPVSIVVVGGPHPSMVGPDVLKCPDIDVGAVGEGEKTLVELLERISSGFGLDGVAGISFRKSGAVVTNPPRGLIEDLDSLPYPHQYAKYVLKDYDKYPAAAFKGVFAIRGCPYACSFCGSRYIWSRSVRFRSPENVAREVQSLREMGLNIIRFDDDTFGVSKDYIKLLCAELKKRCPGLTWNCELHAKMVNSDILAVMKDAGCYQIQIGIESGDDGMLKKIGKNITIAEAVAANDLIRSFGMECHSFFMVGFPDETVETLANTRKAIESIQSDGLIYSVFTPYPGTDLFEVCRQQGSVGPEYDVALYNHQSPANHFCPNIPRDDFRAMYAEIAKIVQRKNNTSKLRRIYSAAEWRRLKDIGFRRSGRKLVSFVRGYLGDMFDRCR